MSSIPAGFRPHLPTRPGIHWHYTAGSTDLRVDVPDPQHPVWRERMAPLSLDQWQGAVPRFPAELADQLLKTLLEAYGRTGREPVEYVDVDVRLDRARLEGRLTVRWAGVVLATAGEHASWTEPRLEECETLTGGLRLEGEGSGRRITWEPGTVLRVRDVPYTSLREQPADSYAIAATSSDDPCDGLRREAHRLLGLRYHHDIPPAPADAFDGRMPTLPQDRTPSLRRVPTDYPHGMQERALAVDPDAGVVYVHRSTVGGYFSEYALPLTEERSALIGALEEEFGRSAAAYAAAGADADAAAILAGGAFTPQRLYRLLGIIAVRDAADAQALLSRSEEEWSGAGWDLSGLTQPVYQSHYDGADPSKCWRAADAARLADAGISASRAYELRYDEEERVRSVSEVITLDRATPNESGRHALDLLDVAKEPVPESLRAELATARTHTTTEEEWKHDSRSGFGFQGWGVWVTLAHHRYTLPSGSHRSLWTVEDGEWSYGEDGDAHSTTRTYLDEKAARAAWQAARDKHRTALVPQQPEPAERPCPGPDVLHCDNCGELLGEGGGMHASLGLACGPDCYDAMSDDPGRHASRYHR